MNENTLEVAHLRTSFFTSRGEVKVVRDVSLSIAPGQICGIVGESGCGKSMVARSIMGLLKHPGKVVGGSVCLCGRELTTLGEKDLRAVRGSQVSMVFQEPMTSLNPLMRVGPQVAESVRVHEGASKEEAKRRAIDMLEAVGIPEASVRYDAYPHELSGGLRQRVIIAMAMVCKPALLIADEPTTALDATVEAQILRLLRELSDEGTAVLIISHNLGVIAELCDKVYVMYAGRIVEQADAYALFDHPTHPYTRGLLGAVKALRGGGRVLSTIPGAVPNLARLPKGCSFSPRCELCSQECAQQEPELVEVAPGHWVSCLEMREESV